MAYRDRVTPPCPRRRTPLPRRLVPTCLAVGLLGFAPGLAAQGIVFEIETTYHSGTEPRVESAEMSVEGEMLKMEILPGEAGTDAGEQVIFRGDRREMIVVDHGRRSYMVVDETTVAAMGPGGAGSAAIPGSPIPARVLEQLPAAERRRIEAMMRGEAVGSAAGAVVAGAGTREFRRTGDRGTHGGYPTAEYEERLDGAVVQELWVTPWSNIEGGAEAQAAFAALEDLMDELLDALSNASPGGEGGLFGGGNPLGGFLELDGVPVYSRTFEDGELESESVLRSARRQRLDPDAFEPPSGYRRMTMGPG